MRRKLMDFRLKWHRTGDMVPDHMIEVIVRFRGKWGRFSTMVYDAHRDIWYMPSSENGKIKQSGGFSTHEIFAWSTLPSYTAIPLDEESKN